MILVLFVKMTLTMYDMRHRMNVAHIAALAWTGAERMVTGMADRFGYGEIGLDINPCRGCEDYDAPDGCKSNGGCGKPTTKADRIRAMTDEELAAFFEDIAPHDEWTFWLDGRTWLDWLRIEAENDAR